MNKTCLTIGVPPVLLNDLKSITMTCEEEGLTLTVEEAINTAIHLYVMTITMSIENGKPDEDVVEMIEEWYDLYRESYQ